MIIAASVINLKLLTKRGYPQQQSGCSQSPDFTVNDDI